MILSRASILLVDDEPLVLDMFSAVLADEGYDVTTARSAYEAINLLEQRSFDVLISDVLLEDMDGFEIQAIAKSKYPTMGVVLITGAPNPIDAQRACIFGINYLSKPTGFTALLRATEQALECSRPEKLKAVA
ncbi:MAG TPA: response regulator [Oligoflexia bacterium]|nr:response regulator [Oligoflexia bacterium]HMP49884.1 response regulator [Oligoflexia bacterium]